MSEKSKRKVNPRRRTLIRLILGMVILAALIPLVLKQFEPEHLYLVYESYDEETLASNLYLYDATLGETMRQITHNTDSGTNIIFDTAENAPFVVYQYQSADEAHPLVLINLKTGDEEILSTRNDLHANFSIYPDGDYVAYQVNSNVEGHLLTYLIDRSKPHSWVTALVHDYDYGELMNEDSGTMSDLRWTMESLTITYIDDKHIVYEHNLKSGRTEYLADTPIFTIYAFPIVSPDSTRLTYLDSASEQGLWTIRISHFEGTNTFFTDESIPVRTSYYYDAWQPSSNNLMIVEMIDKPSLQISQLMLVDTESNQVAYLSPNLRYIQRDPRWNGDGSQLLYARIDTRCEEGYWACGESVIQNMETGEEITMPYYTNTRWVRIP